jgi:predicted ATPase
MAEATSFVGRSREIAELRTLVNNHRLVTVTGTVGVGKTRIALRVAALPAARWPDGVCLAELAALKEPESLPQALAAALGLPGGDTVTPDNTAPMLEPVLGHLRDRSLLLILDACEHLADACAQLAAAIVVRAPGVTVLATSRQPLGLPGEATFPLRPLPVMDAVDLLAERAVSVLPGFTVDSDNRADVSRLCQRLGGIPLAIELAAPRLRALTVSELTAEAGDLRLLSGSRRTDQARHQRLAAAIDWSYELCTPAQRLLWDRLSVFAGGFDVDAATGVCADPTLTAADLPAALAGLVAKSVVLRDGTRYELPGSLADFGAGRLAAADTATAVRNKHIAYYFALAQRLDADTPARGQAAKYHVLRTDHANVMAAIEYALAVPGNDAAAVGIITSLRLYWLISGLLGEGARLLGKALELSRKPSLVRARVLITRSVLLAELMDIDGSAADARAAAVIANKFGDATLLGRACVSLHRAHTWDGDLAEAEAVAKLAVSCLDPAGEAFWLAQLDLQEGVAHLQAREVAACAESCARGLARLPAGELWLSGSLLSLCGLADVLVGDVEQGTRDMCRALSMKQELGDAAGTGFVLGALGLGAAAQRRHERAAWLFGATAALWKQSGRRYASSLAVQELHRRAARGAVEQLGPQRYWQAMRDAAHADLTAIVALAIADSDDFADLLPATAVAAQLRTADGQLRCRVVGWCRPREDARSECCLRRRHHSSAVRQSLPSSPRCYRTRG